MSLKEKYTKLYSDSLNEYIILNELSIDITGGDILEELKELLKDPIIGSNIRRDLSKISSLNKEKHTNSNRQITDTEVDDVSNSYEAFEFIKNSYTGLAFEKTLESLIENKYTDNISTVKFLKSLSLRLYNNEDTLLNNILTKYRKETGRREMMDFTTHKLVDVIDYEPVHIESKAIWSEFISKEAIREYKLKQLS